MPSGTVESKKGDYLRELKEWDRLLDHYEKLLVSDADQWSHYVRYVEAVLAIATKEIDRKVTVIDRAKSFLLSPTLTSSTSQQGSVVIRGPFLARLLFWQELDKNQFDANALFGTYDCIKPKVTSIPDSLFDCIGDFGQFVEEYVRLLGDKPCAFQDLRPFVQCLRSSDQIDSLLSCTARLINGLVDDSDQSPTTVRLICVFPTY